VGAAAGAGAPKSALKPGETAIVEPIATGASDEEFEIEFDEEPTEESGVPIALMDEPTTVDTEAAPAAEDPKPEVKGKKTEEVMADDAVADFLLDLKLDEEN
jgi:hypothetical protein